MFGAALDVVLDRMRDDAFPFEHVAAISGSGQQHGSVFCTPEAAGKLKVRGARPDGGKAADGAA